MKFQRQVVFTYIVSLWIFSYPIVAAEFDLGTGSNLQFFVSPESTVPINSKTDSPLAFVGGESKSVILKNTGKADFTGDIQSALQIDPTNAGFIQTNDCPTGINATLVVGASCTLTLTFSPQMANVTTATLKLLLPSSGTFNIPREVKLEGQGISSLSTELPILGDGHTIDNTTGKLSIDINAQFYGGVSINGLDYQIQVTQKLADTVDVSGEITVNPDHIGKTADIFVYAESTLPPSSEMYYFMLSEGLNIWLWDKQPSNLKAFIPNVQLAPVQKISMYSGHFVYPGTLKVYFGYRLSDGFIVESNQPIDITINP